MKKGGCKDILVKSMGAVVRKRVDGQFAIGGVVDHVLELRGDGLVVVASLVQVWSSRRRIRLVFVVRTDETVALRAEQACLCDGGSAGHGPGGQVTVDGGAQDGEETSEERAHADHFLCGIDILLDGGISIVWKEAYSSLASYLLAFKSIGQRTMVGKSVPKRRAEGKQRYKA